MFSPTKRPQQEARRGERKKDEASGDATRVVLITMSTLMSVTPRTFSALAALAIFAVPAHSAPPEADANPAPDERVLQVQLFLDASAFKPGAIDGRWGEFTRKALVRYEQAQGRDGASYGEMPPAQFDLPLDATKPTLTTYRLTPDDQKLIGSVPEGPVAQSQVDRLPYADFLELLGEKYHATGKFLRQINPGYDWNTAKPGDEVQVPNIASPFTVEEAIALKAKTEKTEANGKTSEEDKAKALTTEDKKPEEEQYSIRIDVAEEMLELSQNGKLVGSYPITAGSESLPAPEGEWFIKGMAWMPTFRWDKAMLEKGERSDNAYNLPPGPNNPVGILWMQLNRDGIGLHGTEDPETIGRATSHGCIRLANWDALDLAKKVLPGVKVTIR